MLRNDAIMAGLIKPTPEEAKVLGLANIKKEKAEAEAAIIVAEQEKSEAEDAEATAKRELDEYAQARFNFKLDLRKSLKNLKKEVKRLERNRQ